MPEDKQPKSETSNKGTSAKSDTTARVVKTIPEGYKKEVRDGKTVYVLKKEVPGGGIERSTSDTTGKKTIKPPVITKKTPSATTTTSTPPVKPKPKPKDKTTPPTETIIPKEEPEKKYVEDILTLEETTPPVKAPVNREVKGEANIYRRINNAASDANQTTYDYADETGNITNKAIRRSFVGDKEVDPNFPFYDEKGNPNPTFIKGSNLNQGANVGTLTNYIMPGDASANTNVEGFKGNLGSAGFGITKNATGGLGVTNYANTPNTFVPPTYDAKGNKIGGGIMYDKAEADKANAIPGSAGKFNLQGDITPESIVPTVPVPPIEKKAKGGVVGYATGGAVAYNSNGQGIDRFGNVISKKEYGVEQAGAAALTGLTGIAADYKKSQTPTTPQGVKPTTPQNPSAPTTGAAGATGATGAVKTGGLSAGQASSIAGVGSLAAGIGASAIDSKNKDDRGRYTSTEAAVGSSALKGAGMGAQLGMAAGPQGALIGAGIGAVAGAGYGLYKGDKDKKAISASNTKMASELSKANVKTEQQLAMANRDAGIEGGRKANLITKDQAMYDENDNLINPIQYAAKGGTIVGKGGPKSDSIFTNSKNGIKPGSFIVPAENNSKAKAIRAAVLGDNPNEMANFKKGGETNSDIAVSNGEHLFTPSERKRIVSYLGQEILEELAPNAENGNDKASGGMIKRADGSYSKRGLWDNIRANAGSGKEPTKEMLKQEAKIKNEYNAGGYVVESSDDRKGKTHKVTGPDGTVKYFGDSNLGQHPKDEARKDAFYARHETNLKNNPFFRAYARKTWAEGGVIGEEDVDFKAQGGLLGILTDRENMREYKKGGLTSNKAKMMLHDGTINGKPITDAQRKYFGWVAGGSKEAKAEGGDIFGGNKDGGKIMAPKMMYANGGKVGKRKHSTGNAYYDKELDIVSSKEYNSISDIESEIDKLNELSNKYKSQYGTYSSEIGDRIRELNGIKPTVGKQQAEGKRTSGINETINSTKKELKSLGATDTQLKQYEDSFKGKSNQLREYALDDAKKKVLKEITSKGAIDSGAKARNEMTEAGKFYRAKGVDALANIERAKRNPEKYTTDQIEAFKDDLDLARRKQEDVASAAQEGGMKLVRERDLYNETKKRPSTNNAPTESKVAAPKAAMVNDSTPYSDKGLGDLLPKTDSTVTPPVTTAPPADPATTGATTTRGEVKGGGVKNTSGASAKSPKGVTVPKSIKFVPKMAQPGEGDDVVVPGDNLSPNERAAVTAKEKIDSENAKKLSDSAISAGTSTPPPTTPTPAPQSKLAQALSGLNTESLIGAGQAALGYNMLKGEKRPGYKFELDPAYQASVERQKQDASYGLSAEQRAMANQDIANALSDTRYSAKNFAGGNAGTAFGQETMAINEGWRNKLGLITKDQELKMAKQQISDQSIKERAGIMTGAKRQAYEDAMGNFQQKQAAGSELVGAGIRNVIGSTRLNKELEAMKAAKAKEDAYLGTVPK